MTPETPTPAVTPQEEPSVWLWAAMFVSLAALAGSLYLSIGMGLKACPLCLYERTFVMGVVGVLAVGLLAKDTRMSKLGLLALPLAAGAVAVVGFHCYLEHTGFLECPPGLLGFGSAPQQALAALSLLLLLLVFDQLARGTLVGILATLLLGGMFAFSGIRSAPPAPLPTKAYDLPIPEDGCRRPYVGNP